MKQKILLLKLVFAFTFVLCFSWSTRNSYAVEDPQVYPNNPFGIHIISEDELKDASNLVNTNGDWGYVTLVIRSDERDTKRWQRVFDEARRLHLIPIVRVASKQLNGGWEKPSVDEIDGWVSFLNSLNWVVKNRYIVVGNEPNHAKEWGGEVNAKEYADYLDKFSKQLKSASDEFFVLPAGLDASAPNDKEHMSEAEFIKQMLNHKPDIFDYLDGWTSHSYPNPNFSGSENASGRGTVRTYEWELDYLKALGIKKTLPVFITETGWAHNGESETSGFYSSKTIGKKFKRAFETAWNDKKIIAVTPFVLNYQNEPFSMFSWKKKDGTFYEFYNEIKEVQKVYGKPVQKVSGEVITYVLPPIIKKVNSDTFYGLVYLKNTGQSIWEGEEELLISFENKKLKVRPYSIFSDVEPGEKALAFYEIEIK